MTNTQIQNKANDLRAAVINLQRDLEELLKSLEKKKYKLVPVVQGQGVRVDVLTAELALLQALHAKQPYYFEEK